MAKGRHQPQELRVDTYQALKALIAALGGKIKPASRVMGTGYSHLWNVAKRKRPPPTLDTLALYCNRVYNNTGLKMVVTVTPDLQLYYSISHEDPDDPGISL
tara:strand:+ start:264 stop:569 length:306 start_codon:yes stop_codon:yes gene_type:complete